MVLCIVSDSYPPRQPFGGIAIFTQGAARILAARGHSVHVLSQTLGEPEDTMDGAVHVHFRRIAPTRCFGKDLPVLGKSFSMAREFGKLHARFAFDLVEFPNFEGLGLITQWRSACPVVVRLHTSMVESLESQGRSPRLFERGMIRAERCSVRRARAVVTHSLAHRERAVGLYGRDDIHVIPHGIFLPAPRESEPEPKRVLTLGRLNARKGGVFLMEAMAAVLGKRRDVVWTVCGASEQDPLVRKFRAEHPEIPVENAVFREFVDEQELQRLYRQATVYASASIYESFGLTFVEAMAHRVPVVGCNVSAIPEIIRNEVNGLLVPPADSASLANAVLRLLDNAMLRAQLSETGLRDAVERFSAERMGAAIEAWYQTVLRNSA